MKKSKVRHIIKLLKTNGFYDFSSIYTRVYPDNLNLSTKGHFCIELNTEFWKHGIHSSNELFSDISIEAVEGHQRLSCDYYNLSYLSFPDDLTLDFKNFWGIPIVREYSRLTKKAVLMRLERWLLSFPTESAFLDHLFKEKRFILPKNAGYYNTMFHELSPELPDGTSMEDFISSMG
jgi:hypothetical protein